MIFYEAVDSDGLTHVVGTQADARAIDKNFTKIDIPIDKEGIMARENERQRLLFDLRAQLFEANPPDTQSNIGADGQPAEAELIQNEPIPERSETASEICIQASDTFDPALLERQVELLAEDVEANFDALEAHQSAQGVGGAFSRGVHVLSIVASGQHQLARLLFASKKKRGWK